jgi:hypothetical protein
MLSIASDGPSLLDLFPKVISMLVDSWGVLGSTTDILEGYLLLDANAVLQVRRAVVNVPDLPSRPKSRDMRPSSLRRSNSF